MLVNMAKADRLVRTVVGLAAVALPAGGWVTGFGWSAALYAVGTILLVTAAVGFCPLYRLVGMGWSHRPARS